MISHVLLTCLLVGCIVIMYGVDMYNQCHIELEQEYYIFMNYSSKHSLVELAKKYHFGSHYIKQNYTKAIELYMLALQNEDYIAYLYLGILYLDIQDIQNSIEYFHRATEKGYFQCFINLGDIFFYEKGHIDIDVAEQYYKAAEKYSTFPACKVLARDKLKIMLIEKTDTYYDKSPIIDIETLMKYDLTDDQVDTIVGEKSSVPGFMEIINDTKPKEYYEPEVRKNDRQNVHDHVVANTVKKSITNLQEKTEIISDKPQTLIDIRKYIDKCNDHKDVVFHVIDHIETSTILFRDTNLQLVDVLYLVWNRMHNECNESSLDKLKQNLYNRLRECNEYDSNVCASGIFSRIIDTLNFCDAESIVEIIPKYALNKELMDKASVISNKFKNEQPQELKDLFEKQTFTTEETKMVDNYTERLKHKLVKEFHKDYVDTGIIDESILYLEIGKWIEYI
jgi:hypothetical protein